MKQIVQFFSSSHHQKELEKIIKKYLSEEKNTIEKFKNFFFLEKYDKIIYRIIFPLIVLYFLTNILIGILSS